jgi:membrane protein implicated in regulation of membrane protease activity
VSKWQQELAQLPDWVTILGGAVAGAITGFLVAISVNAEPSSGVVGLIGLALAAVAAIATVVAVVYARKTVSESKAATRAAAQQHTEQLAEIRAAATAAADQFRFEMEGRQRLADVEGLERGMDQVDRIADLVLDIYDQAREELANPPEEILPGLSGSRLAPMCVRLEIALAGQYEQYEPSPLKARTLASRGRQAEIPAVDVMAMAVDAFDDIHQLMLHFASGRTVSPRSPTSTRIPLMADSDEGPEG